MTHEKQINKVLNVLDSMVSDFREEKVPEGYTKQLITLSDIQIRYNNRYKDEMTLNAFYNWNINARMSFRYDSITYKKYQGLIVDVENYVDERKEERKKRAKK